MNLSYRIGWTCFRVMYATYFRWRVFNAERVPLQGGVILASNHASFLDPPLVGSALQRDSQRAVAPLMIALGAKVSNNSAMTSEQTSRLLL